MGQNIQKRAGYEHRVMSRRLPLLFVATITVAVCALAVSRGYATNDQAPASNPASAGGTGAAGTAEATGSIVQIKIADFAFEPATVTVAAGTAVTWTNVDTASHSVRSNNAMFEEQTMKTNATAKATFASPGTYNYICGLHPFMTATIVVS